MSFIELMFAIGLLIYAVRHNLWLDAPWIKDNHSQTADIKLTEQQNKVFDAWVHDKKSPLRRQP